MADPMLMQRAHETALALIDDARHDRHGDRWLELVDDPLLCLHVMGVLSGTVAAMALFLDRHVPGCTYESVCAAIASSGHE